MNGVGSGAAGLQKPAVPPVRHAFWLGWFVDMVATIGLFVLPYGTELNGVTVFLHGLFGLPGVVLAAATYALVVVAIGRVLREPLDGLYVAGVAMLYVGLALNNVVLILTREPLYEMLLL